MPARKSSRQLPPISGHTIAGLCALLLPLVAFADAATIRQAPRRACGWLYHHDEVPDVPWSIHVFRIDRDHPELEFHTTTGNGALLGMSTVSQQLKSLPPALGKPVAAINGDFYNNHPDYPGDPRDVQIRQWELVSGPGGHVCFWIDTSGNLRMTNVTSQFRIIWPDRSVTPFGLNEERGKDAAVIYTPAIGASTRTSSGIELVLEPATNSMHLPLRAGRSYHMRVVDVRSQADTHLTKETVVLSLGPNLAARLPRPRVGSLLDVALETTPDLKDAMTAIGGGPTLIRNGKAGQWSGFQLRHPRSALGWNKDHIFLVEVDGRQSNLSVGMTLPELTDYMVKLGCENAINLDGGGSATLWVSGNVMNSPSEGQERPGANALVVLQKDPVARSDKVRTD